MPLETGSFIDDLTPSNPPGSDPAGQGDDHIRLLKTTVQGTFPQMGAVFGRVRSQDTAASISSIWNTNHFLVTASATTTVILTLPPASSITSGFYVDVSTLAGAAVVLAASGAGSINGATSLAIPEQSTARAYFVGGQSWRGDVVPNGVSGNSLFDNVTVRGTLSVSGTTILKGAVSIGGAVTMAGAVTISGATRLSTTLLVSGVASFAEEVTISGTCAMKSLLDLQAGQIQFPASQNASSGANVLDDYEEGTFTPTLTFTTPGDISVTYSARLGYYTKVGQQVTVNIRIATSAFTWSTSSGVIVITGMPFAEISVAGLITTGAVGELSGIAITAGRTHATLQFTATETQIAPVCMNLQTGGAFNVATTEAASGSNKTIIAALTYITGS